MNNSETWMLAWEIILIQLVTVFRSFRALLLPQPRPLQFLISPFLILMVSILELVRENTHTLNLQLNEAHGVSFCSAHCIWQTGLGRLAALPWGHGNWEHWAGEWDGGSSKTLTTSSLPYSNTCASVIQSGMTTD